MAEKQTRKTRLYSREQSIELLNDENPRRKGSNRHAIFALIENGMTVGEFLKEAAKFNGGTKDLQILVESGHVSVLAAPAVLEEAPKKVATGGTNQFR